MVTLQENNAIVIIDLKKGEVIDSTAGGSVHLVDIDTEEEGVINQTSMLNDVAHEPDGVVSVTAQTYIAKRSLIISCQFCVLIRRYSRRLGWATSTLPPPMRETCLAGAVPSASTNVFADLKSRKSTTQGTCLRKSRLPSATTRKNAPKTRVTSKHWPSKRQLLLSRIPVH